MRARSGNLPYIESVNDSECDTHKPHVRPGGTECAHCRRLTSCLTYAVRLSRYAAALWLGNGGFARDAAGSPTPAPTSSSGASIRFLLPPTTAVVLHVLEVTLALALAATTFPAPFGGGGLFFAT